MTGKLNWIPVSRTAATGGSTLPESDILQTQHWQRHRKLIYFPEANYKQGWSEPNHQESPPSHSVWGRQCFYPTPEKYAHSTVLQESQLDWYKTRDCLQKNGLKNKIKQQNLPSCVAGPLPVILGGSHWSNEGTTVLSFGGCREKSVAALPWPVTSVHTQVEPKHWGFSLHPDGKCSGIFNFDLGVWLLQWRALQFHILSRQRMSTSCQIATKNGPQGCPWTKPWCSVRTCDSRVQWL